MSPSVRSTILMWRANQSAAAPTMAATKAVPHDPKAALTTKAPGVVSAPGVRLAAVVGGPFAPKPSLVFRGKGIASVVHGGAVGDWCIKPSFAVDLNSIVPVVAVDRTHSQGANGQMVLYRPGMVSSCPSGTIPIGTFQQDTMAGSSTFGQFLLSDDIAFTIIIP